MSATPTQEAMAKAVVTHDVQYKDVQGEPHTATIRKPTVLAQYRFIEMLGPNRAANETYVQMAMPLLYVTAIDGADVITPSTYKELEALIQRLDDAGIAAVAMGMLEKFGDQKSAAETKESLKK